jgi:hypothetical protein
MIRRLLAALLVLALGMPLAGCWVIDEIDKGSALLDKHSNKANRAKREAEEAEKTAAASPKAKKNAVDEYFRQEEADGTTRTFTPGTLSKDIVGCRVGGSVQFMKREQCAARGGQPSA